ncbi:polyprenol phosphomannose-dependent alpha 1,6 mannosyltransferase MptB [Actinocrispum wychmicini]|uniref:Alpha-1,6-mannosyltransferase n=1 Tax=Actinocrispum wychmicini TaxID=1213861 RepID=A0A4R2IRY1_9PSEU|nr:polyprenol phosphomannose-dependent alpha 1,6 mannosyltransferase MptB [Actinocrispum wychmicini]TCO48113.1 alpha-1,6-mannosyltransferase [Actinocrispum wychmicini]
MSAIAAPVSTRYGFVLGRGLVGSALIATAMFLSGNRIVFYLGVALIVWGWLGLRSATRKQLLVAIGVWAVPLVVCPPVLSQDLYIYVAQGAIAHAGLDPYTVGPSGLAGPLTAKVSGIWIDTPSPYGPLFILLMKSVVAVTGEHVVIAALVTKVLMASGLVLLCATLPGLERHLGGSNALWLGAANPLVLVHLVGGPHNDLIMVALLAAGTLLVLDGKHVPGIVAVAFAVAIKVTAAIALPFLVWIWVAHLRRRGFVTAAGVGTVLVVGVFAACTLAAGVDLGWLKALGGNSLLTHWLSLPTGIGQLFGVIPAARIVGWTMLAGIVGWLWWWSREGGGKAVAGAAWALLATVLLSAVTMPWYFTWPLVLAAGFRFRPAIVVGASVWLVLINYPLGDTGLYNWWYVLLTALAAVGVGYGVHREHA